MNRLVWLALILCAVACPGDFPAVMAEANLEKRSELALKQADLAITAARKAYSNHTMEEFRDRLQDAEELVQISYKSLQDTGKRARNSPKHFKRAELFIRGLLRRLANFEDEVGLEDRESVKAAAQQIGSVHEQLLHDIMTKK